jgi:hypothetical protein
MPWKVLLAISMIPPVGRATTPTSPFPIPLKKPAAPSFLAPSENQTTNIQRYFKISKYELNKNLSLTQEAVRIWLSI